MYETHMYVLKWCSGLRIWGTLAGVAGAEGAFVDDCEAQHHVRPTACKGVCQKDSVSVCVRERGRG